jgi:outer membrane protein
MKRVILFFLYSLVSATLFAQEKWDLKSVVEYAMDNNLQVKQGDIQALNSEFTYKQSKAAVFPTVNFSSSASVNAGNNQDPITFSRITESYFSTAFQLQSSADIFNFFSKRNTILANEWEWRAAKANVDKLRYDIALTAANGYLQVLLCMEQEKIAELQILQTKSQLTSITKQVEAGALPQLNAIQLEAQLSLDSVNLVSAKGNTERAKLQLKTFMNLDASTPFEIEAPPVDRIPVETLGDLQPEFVYQTALQNLPQQKANEYRLMAAKKMVKASKGSMLPTLTAFGSLGTTYNNQGMEIVGVTPVMTPIGNVQVGGVQYDVFPNVPTYLYNYKKTTFTEQFSDNFRQSIGVGLSVPLFNGLNLRTAYKRNQLNVKSLELQKQIDDQNLKNDIYNAYNDALIAYQKFEASKKNVMANEQAFDFATKRLEVGMLNTFEWITTQNNLLTARLNYLINQFDFVFKMKVLEFYKGQGLKL